MSHMNSSKVESAHLEIVNKFSSENSSDSPQDASNGEHLRLEGSDAESHAKFKSKAPVPLDSNTSQTQSTFLQSFESFVSDAQPQDDITDRKEKYEATLSPHREASLSSSTSNSKRKLRNKGLECVVASVQSGASSICDSVGVRTRKASRNPIIITLSSDSELSEPKPKHDSDEDIKPFVDAGNGKRKRLAHIKAEYVRKFTEIRRKRNIKQTNYKDDDSSSSASEPIKSKKNKPKRPQKHLSIAVNDKRYFGRSVVRNKKCFKLRNRVQKTFSQQRHFNPSSHSPTIGALRSKRTRIVSRNHVSNIASIISTRNRLCQREPGSPTQVGNVSRSPKCRFSQKKSTRPIGSVGRPRKNPLNRKDNDAPSNTPEVSKIQLSRKDKSTPSKSPLIAKMQSAQKDKDTPPNTPVISKMQSSEKVSESAVVTADFPNNQPTHKNIVPYNNNVSQENQTKDSAVTFNTESKKNCSGNKKCSKKRLFNNVPRSQIVILKKRGRPRLSESKNLVKASTKLVIDKKIKPFLQNAPCFDISPKLPKCSECRIVASNKSRKMQNSYCRFLEYRKLSAAKNGTIMNAGFSEPSDATEEHLKLWLPRPDHPPEDLNVDTSKLLLEHVGNQFCDLIEQEKEALSLHIGKDKTITWKRIVQGVREMCDVCDTTLFNIHWVCPKCGLAICIDCYKVRKQGILVEDEENQLKGRDEYQWLLCAGRQPHEQEKLIMAQIVPGTALWTMQETMHKIRELWKIPAYCKCSPEEENSVTGKYISTGISKQLMSGISKSFASETTSHFFAKPKESSHWKNSVSNFEELDVEINDNALKWLTNDVPGTRSSQTEDSTQTKTDSNKEESQIERTTQVSHVNFEDFSSIRNLLLHESAEQRISPSPKEYLPYPFDELVSYVIESKLENSPSKFENNEEKKNTQRYPQQNNGREPMPIRIFTMTESYTAYSQVPHSWLCNGRLLLLHQPHHHNNLILFQEQWKRGQPIMVKGINDGLNMSLWHPDGFCQDFGEIKNDLVNCKTGAILTNLPMRKFWEGFENFSKRMKDEFGEYMLLKLKDWPPGEDFSEKLPGRFQDLMNGLPLPEYTHRNGILNLAGRLPAWFVRPDLGPKMYNAYGSALYPSKGTTNLHLDVSDAVNVMVYVGIPHDGNDEDHINEALNAIDEGGCDSLMRERVRSRGVRPGALWHIYNARDADKIREMLNKVAIERGEKLEAHHDPIHDQSWYIDAELRKRLYQEFNVEGYAIAQCLGDAVFIPAGAPHQVRNLHSCVKVAEDFVSPENIAHCFKLTQEFRHLSDTHTNHEDKLQIKNIIYHVVRDSLSHLIDKSPNN